MAQVTLPYNLTAGSPENVNNLMSNLNALKDGVNTIDTAQIAAGAVGTSQLASAVGNFGAWTSYTPSLTATTTNPNLGSTGKKTGYYAQIGKTVIGRTYFEFGGTGVSAGAGGYRVTLPVTRNSTDNNLLGVFIAYDGSTNNQAFGVIGVISTTVAWLYYSTTNNGTSLGVESAQPWTWASGDSIALNWAYEAA